MNSITIKKEKFSILIFLGISLVSPNIYHLLGMKGNVFLPIFLGVIIGSYFMSSTSLLGIALLAPLLSHLLTGMPPVSPYPMLQLLTYESVMLAFFFIVIKKKSSNPLLLAFIPVVLGRFSTLLMIFLFSNIDLKFWTNNFLIGLPGITLNIAVSLMVYIFFCKKQS